MVSPPSKSSSVSPCGACPVIDSLTSFGLFIWTQEQDANSLLKAASFSKTAIVEASAPETENYLFLPVTIVEGIVPNEYCDFVFPVFVGFPHNTPLDKKWKEKIGEQFKPGCYLAAMATHGSPNVQHVPVSVHGQPTVSTFLERMNANLLFVMTSANPLDKNFTRQAFIGQLDDIELVHGYVYPAVLKDSPPMVSVAKTRQTDSSSAAKEAEFKQKTGVARVLKRYCDQAQLHRANKPVLERMKQSFVVSKATRAKEGLSERFNFLLGQDSYAVIVDHSSQYSPQGYVGPYFRLIRSGAYVSFEGNVRYAQLTQRTLTYLNRHNFLSRLTFYPLVVLQEGVKAFDVYYATDGLDATYVDNCPPASLLQLDWYQLQLDFKLDGAARQFKGHIVRLDELTDLLTTFRLSQMQYDIDKAATLKLIELPPRDADPQVLDRSLVLSLQQVTYNYASTTSGSLEVIWSVYIQVQTEHISPTDSSSSKSVYLYLKSFLLIYHWSRLSGNAKASKKEDFEEIFADEAVSRADLYRAGWSNMDYARWLPVYSNRMYPYQNCIKKWLFLETRQLISNDARAKFFTRPTALADKLIYRNAYFNAHVKPVQNSVAQGGSSVKQSPGGTKMTLK